MKPISKLSDRELDRLLAGEVTPGEDDLAELATFVHDMRALFREPGAEMDTLNVAAMVEAARLEAAGNATRDPGELSPEQGSAGHHGSWRSPMRALLAGNRRRRLAVLAAAALVVAVGAASAFGTARDLFLGTRVNSKIAFFSLRDGRMDTYVMNPDGSEQRRLTLSAWDGVPIWSPDGRRIVFLHGRDDVDVYVANADGSGRRRLTRGHMGERLFPGSWSPDGRRIAFQSDPGGGDVYIVDVDGTGERNLTGDGSSCCPSWSPDGRRIAFTHSWPPFPGGSLEIHIMNADGSGRRRLLRNGVAPLWSPDGERIMFVRLGGPGRRGWAASYIYVMNADGSDPRRLTRMSEVNDSGPAWSPDGRKILFVGERDRGSRADGRRSRNFEIYVINADGSGKRNLTRHPGFDFAPEWSPDGKKIAFGTKRDGNFEIYVMNADGADQQNLTQNPATDRAPSWSPGRKPGS
jgi:TolB protein